MHMYAVENQRTHTYIMMALKKMSMMDALRVHGENASHSAQNRGRLQSEEKYLSEP